MKKFISTDLLEKLRTDTRQVILETKYLLQQDPEFLLLQPAEGKWSVAQIIEHLNTYGRYYLPLIQNALTHSHKKSPGFFKPGWLGDLFTKSMLPKQNGQIGLKMQAPKPHRPSNDIDSKVVLDEFLEQQQLLLELLEQAKTVNIGIRIPISLTRLIRLKLGDTFRFLIAHHQRHFVQAANTLLRVKGELREKEVKEKKRIAGG